ncbi:MAG: NAD(P)/FAD-dependent oxidoreductase [Thermogutta sp.]
MSAKQAIIIGAGPAGLTAAFELLDRTDITPLVIEMSDSVGGISRTVNYKGNRIDLGGHRFFSKSDRVMEWWLQRMPLQKLAPDTTTVYQAKSHHLEADARAPDPNTTDRVMLLRRRKSRIYFLRKFFDYPLRLNTDTVAKLGLIRMARIVLSYGWAALFATRNPRNLEEFFISRFGRELYLTFFKSYTEKVWGESCSRISAEWGAQRIKGLSIGKALHHSLRAVFTRKRHRDIGQKTTETSLIEEFLYPKFGPGQMWETVAEEVTRRGGKVLLRQRVTKLHVEGSRISAVAATDMQSGQVSTYTADYVFSTMPVKELIAALDTNIPDSVREVADGLIYRDFITVGLLVKRLKVQEQHRNGCRPITDNWIYIQEPDVKLGRLQVFNNWSPYMVADPATTWLGLEYFCYDSDDLWNLADEEMIELAKTELARIGLIEACDVLDGTVLRVPKAYPAYFGTYHRFGEVRAFVDRFSNLFLVGRNGMHKYNNQDHSMLTAMTAVDNIVAGKTEKANIWEVNTEQDYHEARNDN